ncbi:hypothetical protein BN1013_01624 [Candidatus Rubidus massiliensis]|nr:hypothetical protein BN1013_01624 [Candidatus Rubidus massiliensis]
MNEEYTKIKFFFEDEPEKLLTLFLEYIEKEDFTLAHQTLDLIHIKYGELFTLEFVLNNIILNANSKLISLLEGGDFFSLNSFFTHLNKIIDDYKPFLHDFRENENIKKVIQVILMEQYTIQEFSGLSFHNHEILLGRAAGLGDEKALNWYQESILKDHQPEAIWYNVAVGSYEAEKSKWEETNSEIPIIHLKKALLAIAEISTFPDEPNYFIDYMNIILEQIVSLVKNKTIKVMAVKDSFDLVLSMYQIYSINNSYKHYFLEIYDRYKDPQNEAKWLMGKMQGHKNPSHVFQYALELAKLDKRFEGLPIMTLFHMSILN